MLAVQAPTLRLPSTYPKEGGLAYPEGGTSASSYSTHPLLPISAGVDAGERAQDLI